MSVQGRPEAINVYKAAPMVLVAQDIRNGSINVKRELIWPLVCLYLMSPHARDHADFQASDRCTA